MFVYNCKSAKVLITFLSHKLMYIFKLYVSITESSVHILRTGRTVNKAMRITKDLLQLVQLRIITSENLQIRKTLKLITHLASEKQNNIQDCWRK